MTSAALEESVHWILRTQTRDPDMRDPDKPMIKGCDTCSLHLILLASLLNLRISSLRSQSPLAWTPRSMWASTIGRTSAPQKAKWLVVSCITELFEVFAEIARVMGGRKAPVCPSHLPKSHTIGSPCKQPPANRPLLTVSTLQCGSGIEAREIGSYGCRILRIIPGAADQDFWTCKNCITC